MGDEGPVFASEDSTALARNLCWKLQRLPETPGSQPEHWAVLILCPREPQVLDFRGRRRASVRGHQLAFGSWNPNTLYFGAWCHHQEPGLQAVGVGECSWVCVFTGSPASRQWCGRGCSQRPCGLIPLGHHVD